MTDKAGANDAIKAEIRRLATAPARRGQRLLDERAEAAIVDKLRAGYFSDPRATEEGFERALPELREEYRRRRAVEGATEP